MIAALTGWLAKSALMSSPAGAFLKMVPAWAWKVLAVVAAVVALFLLHQHFAHKAIAAAEKRGSDAAYANVAKQAADLTAKANALNAKLAAQMRKETDAKLAAVHDDAAGLQLRGPGAARCPGVTRLPGAAGGHIEAAAKADAAGPPLLADDRAGVSWRWLVDRSEEHDALLIEDQAWRGWYARFSAEWAKWNADAAKARTTP